MEIFWKYTIHKYTVNIQFTYANECSHWQKHQFSPPCGITSNKFNQNKVHRQTVFFRIGAIMFIALQVTAFQLECNVCVYFYEIYTLHQPTLPVFQIMNQMGSAKCKAQLYSTPPTATDSTKDQPQATSAPGMMVHIRQDKTRLSRQKQLLTAMPWSRGFDRAHTSSTSHPCILLCPPGHLLCLTSDMSSVIRRP